MTFWIETLQKSITYIEEHLLEDIHFDDVAKEMNMSPYEFQRAFSFMSGMTMKTYIRNRRLSLAGQELIDTNKKIIDIALKYGFESQDGFTKAFTRFHGISPKHARSLGTQLSMFNPLVLKVSLEGATKIEYKIEKKGKQMFAALIKSFPTSIISVSDNCDISDFWKECYEKNLIEPLKALKCAKKRDLYGLCAPLKEDETTFEYGIGVLLDNSSGSIDLDWLREKGYRIWETEPSAYVVFECFGEDGNCIQKSWEIFYKEFLPQSEYQSCIKTDYEIYFDKGKDGLMCELWIPIQKSM